jgi:hypothetical protein
MKLTNRRPHRLIIPSHGELKPSSALSSHGKTSMRPEMNSDGHVRDSKSQIQDLEQAPTAEDEPPRDTASIQTASSTGSVHSVFGKHQKLFIVTMALSAGFFSPESANIYFPALNSLARDLNVSKTLINLTLTSYMVD